MVFLWLIFAFQTIATVQSDLISCDQPVIARQLCKMNKTMENIHNIEEMPDFSYSSETPLSVSSILNFDSIPEFNENEGTITVNALLKVSWNDTRISFIPNDAAA